ncbi:hypothetical protein [Aquimarina atlantica]|nr:hypothetical protein [Aquimarina atlantica]
MRTISTVLFILTTYLTFGQYPFEKYPSPTYLEYKDWKLYDWTTKKQSINSTLKIDQFFDNKDALTIQLTSFTSNGDNPSVIRVFRNKTQVQKITEQMFFSSLNIGHEPIRVVDINGDGLKDLKIIVPYMGNGIAELNVRVIYLFQTKDQKFIKISFTDMMDGNRVERDFDGNGNFEIITMNLTGYERHNYWVFNIFEYNESQLKCFNNKENYPIMIQFLNRDNYEITDKIDREKMKEFAIQLPDDYDRKE